MNDLLRALSKRARDRVYLALGVVGVTLGALNVGFLAGTGGVPLWLSVVNAVALFLGVPAGAQTARANITQSTYSDGDLP